MVAARLAARDLQIEQTVAHPVAAHGFAQHDGQGGPAHGHGDVDLAERAFQAGEMPLGVGQAAAEHRPDLIDAVAELVTPVVDVNDGNGVRRIGAVDISDT